MSKKKPQDITFYKGEQSIDKKSKELRRSSLILAIVLLIIGTYFGLTAGAYAYDYDKPFLTSFGGAALKIAENPLYCFPIAEGAVRDALLIDMLIGLVILYNYSINLIKVHHNVNTLKGSSEWSDLNYLNRKYAEMVTVVSNKSFARKLKALEKIIPKQEVPEGYTNAIYSQNFRMSLNPKFNNKAVNTLILGTTGSGKSRYELKPNLLQMNCSYVITDPSGGILKEVGETLRRFGYNIRVFDLSTMSNCSTYNPMKYCYQESDVRKLVNAFIKNTAPPGDSGGGAKDPFWDDAMNAFLCSCVSLLINYGDDPKIMGGKTYTPCFANLCELTRMANRQSKNATKEQTKNNTASGSELNLIFENLRASIPEGEDKPYALREWENFKIAPEKTSTTILMTTAVRLDPFNIEQVRNLTSTDTINLDTFSEQRDALFVIIPTNDRTYNFLVSFMYTQLFDILYKKGENSDGTQTIKLQNGELVKFFTREESEVGDAKAYLQSVKTTSLRKVTVNGVMGSNDNKPYAVMSEHNEIISRFTLEKDAFMYQEQLTNEGKILNTSVQKLKKKDSWKFWKKKIIHGALIDDSYYEILDENGEVISRRPTESLAKAYQKDLLSAKMVQGNGQALPNHVRFLMDEFPNIGEVPEFKEKLATIRKYEISVCVICQTITQSKGMYPEIGRASCREGV